MFTGLIQQIGKLKRRETAAGGRRLVVTAGQWTPALAEGESIAVSGVCLTVVRTQGTEFACDLLRETMERTCLGAKRPGGALNLERALRLGDPLGGHLVTGHVDGIGTLLKKRAAGRDWVLRFACPAELLKGLALKGSVAVDGVSLTLAGLDSGSFTAQIIPFTWQHTSLRELRAGDPVNLETDLIGKHVRRWMESEPSSSPLTLDRLHQAGFGE